MAARARPRTARQWLPVANLIKVAGTGIVIHEEFFRHIANNLLVGAGIVMVAGVQVVQDVLSDVLDKIFAKVEDE